MTDANNLLSKFIFKSSLKTDKLDPQLSVKWKNRHASLLLAINLKERQHRFQNLGESNRKTFHGNSEDFKLKGSCGG